MKKVVFDSCAIITFFRQEAGYEFIRDLLVKMANEQSEGYITTVNVGEIHYMIARKSNQKNAEAAVDALLHFPIHIIDVDLKLSIEAAKIKAKFSLSFGDAFSAALTISKRATLITGDTEFDSLAGETNFKVKFLPTNISQTPFSIVAASYQKDLKDYRPPKETKEIRKS